MPLVSLELFDIFPDQRVKHTVTVLTAELAVLYKFLICRLAYRAYDSRVLAYSLLGILNPQKAGKKFSEREFPFK